MTTTKAGSIEKVTSALANVNYEIESWHREQQEKKEIKENTAKQIERKFGLEHRLVFEQNEGGEFNEGTGDFKLSSLDQPRF